MASIKFQGEPTDRRKGRSLVSRVGRVSPVLFLDAGSESGGPIKGSRGEGHLVWPLAPSQLSRLTQYIFTQNLQCARYYLGPLMTPEMKMVRVSAF